MCNLSAFLSSFSHWHVKGFSSKRIALKVDVLEGRKIHSLQVRPCFFAGNFKGWGSEGVKHYVYFLLLPVMSARHVRTLAPYHHHHHHQLPVDVNRFGPAVRPRLVTEGPRFKSGPALLSLSLFKKLCYGLRVLSCDFVHQD